MAKTTSEATQTPAARAIAAHEAERLARLRLQNARHKTKDSTSSATRKWVNAHRRAWLDAFDASREAGVYTRITAAQREAAAERAKELFAVDVKRGECGCAICVEPDKTTAPCSPSTVATTAPSAKGTKETSKKPTLSSVDRDVVESWLAEGFSQRETAEQLGLTRGKVRWVADLRRRAGGAVQKVSASEAGRRGGRARAGKAAGARNAQRRDTLMELAALMAL